MKQLFLDTEFTGLHQRTRLVYMGLVVEVMKNFTQLKKNNNNRNQEI